MGVNSVVAAGAFAALGVLLPVSGCGERAAVGGSGPVLAGASSIAPFAPASVRIHPLTHIDISGPAPVIVLHFELRDRYGDTVKALGLLQVELFRQEGGLSPGIESQQRSWDVRGMLEADENAGRFDIATRTYRVPLSGPDWLTAWESGGAEGGQGEFLRLRLVYETTAADGGTLYLDDEFLLAR